MKRGFLNTRKAKQRVAEAVDAESTQAGEPPHKKSKDDDEKGECLDPKSRSTRAEYVEFNTIDSQKLPKTIQQQVDNQKNCTGYGKNRVVFRVWPRDPKGQTITVTSLRAKEAANGIDLWGATLYDFYWVLRAPDVKNYLTISTGSRLAKWMRQHGELIAEDELYWADKEEDPKEVPVVDIGELIRCHDAHVASGVFNQFSSRKEVREKEKTGWSILGEATDEDSTPPPNDQGDNIRKEKEEEAAPVIHSEDQTAGDNIRKEKEEKAAPVVHSEDQTAGDNIKKEKEEEAAPVVYSEDAVSVADDYSEDQTASDEFMLETESEASSEDSADHPTGDRTLPLPDIDSPFHPDHYPSPYPFIPFTHEAPKLQQRVPLHLLPKKLHVHDPWNTLTVDKDDSNQKPEWLSKVAKKGDIVRTYSLSLAPQSKEAASKAQKLAEVVEDEAAKEESVSHIFPSDKEGPTEEPLIEVVLPLRPRKRTQVEEAHLYLSPCAVGVGHHSIVRSAEWELPRDLFVEAHLCKACVQEDVRRQVQKLKDEGEWEALLKEQEEKPEETMQGSSGGEPLHASGPKQTPGHVTIREHEFPEVTGSYVLRPHWDARPGGERSADADNAPSLNEDQPADTVGNAATTGGAGTDVKINAVDGQDLEPAAKIGQEEAPDAGIEVDDNEPYVLRSAPKVDKGKGKMEPEQDNGSEENDWEESEDEQSEEYSGEEIFTLEPPRVIRIASYSGPVLRIHTTVKWRSPSEKQCDHESSFFGSEPVPRTATVSIVAKLSFEYDLHLAQEAANYQSFPDHFFQHWNGYNVIPPIHEPIPVGALCPQFYGYYTPDDPTDGKYRGRRRYLSPILLLEHCGSEIDPDKLCQDDKQECASLILRFNRAGWLHGSLAARNIMWQQGKPTEWPIERPHSVKSFRLIDFGRSAKVNRTGLMGEDEIALRLFYLLHHGHKKKQTEKK